MNGSSPNLEAVFWQQLELAADEEDACAAVLEVPEATGGRFDRLDAAVESFGEAVADGVPEPGEDVVQPTLEQRNTAREQRRGSLGAVGYGTCPMATVINQGSIGSGQVCQLLRQIRRRCRKPVTIALDNASYHQARVVQEQADLLGVELLFLPPYSPNLNLIEHVWKLVKKMPTSPPISPSTKPAPSPQNCSLRRTSRGSSVGRSPGGSEVGS